MVQPTNLTELKYLCMYIINDHTPNTAPRHTGPTKIVLKHRKSL